MRRTESGRAFGRPLAQRDFRRKYVTSALRRRYLKRENNHMVFHGSQEVKEEEEKHIHRAPYELRHHSQGNRLRHLPSALVNNLRMFLQLFEKTAQAAVHQASYKRGQKTWTGKSFVQGSSERRDTVLGVSDSEVFGAMEARQIRGGNVPSPGTLSGGSVPATWHWQGCFLWSGRNIVLYTCSGASVIIKNCTRWA